MITILMSCLPTALTAVQRAKLNERVQWQVLNVRGGRALLDVIGDLADLQWVIDRLTENALDPVLIAAFRSDTGQRIKTVAPNVTEYLAVAPDVLDYTNPQVPVRVRPVSYIQAHGWFGWPAHSLTPEP